MDRQINELPETLVVNTSDLLHLKQGATDYKLSIETLGANISSVANIQEDVFSGDGVTTDFTLTSNIASTFSLWAVIDGVPQSAADYTTLTNVISFDTAPPNGTDNIFIRNALVGSLTVPADASVTTAKLQDESVTLEKIDPSVVLGGPSLGTSSVIRTNAQVISEDITFLGTENGMTAGPISIADTFTVTVTTGSTWSII